MLTFVGPPGSQRDALFILFEANGRKTKGKVAVSCGLDKMMFTPGGF